MRKQHHSSANVLLLELVIVILFFMLCVSALVEVLGTARLKSAGAKTGTDALLLIENLEERLAASADAAEELAQAGFAEEDGAWILRDGRFVITARESAEPTEAGSLRTVTFSAEQENGTKLFELPVVNYIPGEVSP